MIYLGTAVENIDGKGEVFLETTRKKVFVENVLSDTVQFGEKVGVVEKDDNYYIFLKLI